MILLPIHSRKQSTLNEKLKAGEARMFWSHIWGMLLNYNGYVLWLMKMRGELVNKKQPYVRLTSAARNNMLEKGWTERAEEQIYFKVLTKET